MNSNNNFDNNINIDNFNKHYKSVSNIGTVNGRSSTINIIDEEIGEERKIEELKELNRHSDN